MAIEVKAWKCEKCGKAYLNKAATDDCCKEKPETTYTCRVCGCEVEKHWTICPSCLDQERYIKAKKVKYSEYEIGYLWDETQDAYFPGKEELQEKYYEDAEDLFGLNPSEVQSPTWCYGCVAISFSIDIDSAIQSAEEEMYEDFDEIIDIEGLRDYVKEWNAKQTGKSYEIDYKTVVLLNE